ncbi:MAG: hypothetical protein WDN66_02425 [Candidatus Saccharibacteria bacterium]
MASKKAYKLAAKALAKMKKAQAIFPHFSRIIQALEKAATNSYTNDQPITIKEKIDRILQAISYSSIKEKQTYATVLAGKPASQPLQPQLQPQLQLQLQLKPSQKAPQALLQPSKNQAEKLKFITLILEKSTAFPIFQPVEIRNKINKALEKISVLDVTRSLNNNIKIILVPGLAAMDFLENQSK